MVTLAQQLPSLFARLARERYTGEIVICWAEGTPQVAKVISTRVIPLESLDNARRDVHDASILTIRA